MTWPVLKVNSWEHFLQISSHLTYGSPATVPYLFRGQADSEWRLEPSLLRSLGTNITTEDALALERVLMREFTSQARLHLDQRILSITTSDLQWWVLMQHHRAPTRLLDWTASVFVAAYFAVEQLWERDGAVWLFHPKTLVEQSKAQMQSLPSAQRTGSVLDITDPRAPPLIFLWFPENMTQRMVAQQGAFTYCSQVLGVHDSIIDQMLADRQVDGTGEAYRKLIIPAEQKPQFLRKLRPMNVTANSLFPGVDGLGRSVADIARLASRFPLDMQA